jgi:hypothetical protein
MSGAERLSARPEMLQMQLGFLIHELPTSLPDALEKIDALANRVVREKEMLLVLVGQAEVTESLKRAITDAYLNAAVAGRRDEEFPWDTLSHPQGIFSEDPKTRMGIERTVYKFKKGEFEAFNEAVKIEPDEDTIEMRDQTSTFIRVMEREFQDLYGEPIETASP